MTTLPFFEVTSRQNAKFQFQKSSKKSQKQLNCMAISGISILMFR